MKTKENEEDVNRIIVDEVNKVNEDTDFKIISISSKELEGLCVFSKKTKMPVLKNAIAEITQYMGLREDWKELREELEKWKIV